MNSGRFAHIIPIIKKTILIVLVLVLVIGSAFVDVRFSGFAKVLWGYDFNNQKTG